MKNALLTVAIGAAFIALLVMKPANQPTAEATGAESRAAVVSTGPTSAEQLLAQAKAEQRPVMLSFRSQGCAPCEAMTAIVGELRPRHAAKVAIIDISLDHDSPDAALIGAYGIRVKPTTILLDTAGEPVETKIGVWPAEELEARLKTLAQTGK